MSEWLKGCTIAFLGIYHSLVKIKSEIKQNGGTVVSLTSNITHLITNEDQLGTTSVEKAQNYNAFIVSEDWIIDSLEQGKKLPESKYFIGSKQPDKNIAKEKAQQSFDSSKPLISSYGDYQASPLLLQPSSLETSYGNPQPISFNYDDKKEEEQPITTSYFQSMNDPIITPPQSSSNNQESTEWVPIKTGGKKIKTNAVRCSGKQPNSILISHTTLQLSNLGNNNNKYYALELHHHPSLSTYSVFCHFGRTCDLEKNPKAGQKCYRYVKDLNNAKICFQNLYDEKLKKGYKPIQLLSSNIGSDVAKKARLQNLPSISQLSSNSNIESSLHPDLQRIISSFYEEASSTITASVNAKITSRGIETTLGVLTKSQIEKGESIITKLKNGLSGKAPISKNTIETLSNDFYSLIPHKIGRSASERKASLIDSLAKLEQKLELLQLMKDMLSLINSYGGSGNVLDLKYKALKTNIIPLDKNSSLFNQVKNFILSTQTTDYNSFEIKNIFAVKRPQERLSIVGSGNVQLQFHGSRAANYVGLLSRGLLMPKIVVSRGGGRTDAGLLGNGIYFSNSFSTAAQYAYPDKNGSRFVLANRVSLGRCKDYIETQIGLEKPPYGYHSVHGVSKATEPSSAFKDEEFVVFNTNQQVQEYIVEFIPINSNISKPFACEQPPPLSKSLFDSLLSSNTSNLDNQFDIIQPNTSSSFSYDFSSSAQQTQFSTPLLSQSNNNNTTTPIINTQQDISGNNKNIQEEEEKYRKLFANDRNNFTLRNPYLLLIDIMNNVSSFNYQSLTNEENSWVSLLTKYYKKGNIGSPCICSSLTKFEENWLAFTEGQFKGLNWNNIFIAGGAVLSCLQPNFSTSTELSNPFNSSDIDIFIYGLSKFEANEKLRHICNIVKKNTNSNGTIVRSKHAITILGEYPYRHTQIILRIYQSPAEILMGFDIDCCCVGYNGERIYALPRAKRALTKQYNLIDLSRRSLTYEIRLHKYANRGYIVKVPGLDMSRVNPNLYHRKLSDVTGLAKLLILNNIQITGTAPSSRKQSSSSLKQIEQEDSDYSSVYIPWGPNWMISLIVSTLNKQSKKLQFTKQSSNQQTSNSDPFFVTDIHGAIQGTNKDITGNLLSNMQSEFASPLQWLTENPGRQILTGSFHPITDNEWWTDAYKQWEPIQGISFRVVSTPSKKSKITPMKIKRKSAKSKVPRKTKLSRKKARASPSQASSFVPLSQLQQPTTWGQVPQQSGNTWDNSTSTQSNNTFLESFQINTQQNQGFSSATTFGGNNEQNVIFGKTPNLQDIIRPSPVASQSLLSSNFTETIAPQSDISKLLLLVSQLCKDGLLSQEEKSILKNLIIRKNATVVSALEVFEIERDLEELADSFRRICKLSQ